MSMKGKTLVISGATRGIGKAILYRFAQEGVNVAFTYNKNDEEAQKIQQDVEQQYNIKARFYPLNVLEPEQYKDLFVEIDKDFEQVNFFISNAIIWKKRCGRVRAVYAAKAQRTQQYLHSNRACFCCGRTRSSKAHERGWRRQHYFA